MLDDKKIPSQRDNQQKKRDADIERHKSVNFLRLRYNIIHRPWIVAVSLLLFLLGWCMTLSSIPLPGGSQSLLLLSLWSYAVKAMILLIAMLLSLAVIITPPPKARTMEVALSGLSFENDFNHSPALVSRLKIPKTDIEKLVFYSYAIGLKRWDDWKEDIQDALDVTFVEAPMYAYGRRDCIELTVSYGVKKSREELLTDDEL